MQRGRSASVGAAWSQFTRDCRMRLRTWTACQL